MHATARSRAVRAPLTVSTIVVLAVLLTTWPGARVSATPLTTPDPTAQTNGRVWAIVQGAGRIYIGGMFTTAGGDRRLRVAALRASTGRLVRTWHPQVDGDVRALALSADGAHLFVGGEFAEVNATPRPYLAKISTRTGEVDPDWQPRVSAKVYSLALAGDRLYVGGPFRTVDGRGHRHLAAVSTATGRADRGFSPRPNRAVKALAVSPDGTVVYLGGAFTAVAGRARTRLAAVSAAGVVRPWRPPVAYPVFDLTRSPNGRRVYAAVAGPGGRVMAFDTSTGRRPLWVTTSDGDFNAIAASDTTVYAGGHYDRVMTTRRRKLAALDARSGRLLPWNPDPNSVFGVYAVTTTPTSVLVGGDFTKVGRRSRSGFARFAATLGAAV